jgi:membrane protease YdiL (CAAX protease family)
VDIARDPPAAWYRPIVPPVWGAALNVLVGALFLWWFVLRPGGRADARRRETFRLRPVPRAARPWAVAAAAGAAVAVNAALVVLPRFAGLPSREPVLEHYAGLPGGALAIAAVAVCTAPFLEEFFFRGWAQGPLERRMPAWPAILVTAGTFAALHGLDAFGLVPRAALATAAGYAVWATQSIWSGVALHAAYNASLFVGGAALPALLPHRRAPRRGPTPSAPRSSSGRTTRACSGRRSSCSSSRWPPRSRRSRAWPARRAHPPRRRPTRRP